MKLIVAVGLMFIGLHGVAAQDSLMAQKVACQIAFDHMSDDTKAKISALTGSALDSESFTEICTKRVSFAKPKEAYANVPRDMPQIRSFDCLQAETCLMAAVRRDSMALADKNRSNEERTELLSVVSWQVRLMHFPLSFGTADDRGGINVRVKDKRKCASNINQYWRRCALKAASKSEAPADYGRRLSAAISEEQKARWLSVNALGWANESLDIVRLPEMGYCVMKDSVCHYSKRDREFRTLTENQEPSKKMTFGTTEEGSGPKLSEQTRKKVSIKSLRITKTYRDWAAHVTETRLQQAGVRLAAHLGAML